MPLQNLLGWSLTGLVYMGISRLLWGSDISVAAVAPVANFPFLIYAANLLFAMALSASAGLWPPVVLAIVAGLLPAALALRPWREARAMPTGGVTRPVPLGRP
jgi:putative membrane protein